MPNQSIQSWQNVKMYWFTHHESVKLQYTDQFSHVTKYIWIDSIKSKNGSNDSVEWINQPNIFVDLFGKPPNSLTSFGQRNVRLRWPFLVYWTNSIDLIIPVPQSQSTQSPTLWIRIDSVTNQLTWKTDWINSTNFAEKWVDSNQSTQSRWLVHKSGYCAVDLCLNAPPVLVST